MRCNLNPISIMNETFLNTICTEKTYTAKERRALILKLIDSNDEVSVNDLGQIFHTSTVTIRKDLTILQQRNLLNRTRGGAIRKPVENLNEDNNIAKKRMFNAREKECIGKAAAKLIRNGDHIMLDSGTTTLEIAKNLDNFYDLTIITNSVNIAEVCLRYNRFTVIVLGGHLRINSHSTVGPLALNTLSHFSNYKLFLGVDSFSLESGISTPNLEEAMLNQAMIAQASRTIAVFDASKFNKRSFCHIAQVQEIDTIITDRSIPSSIATQLRTQSIQLIVV